MKVFFDFERGENKHGIQEVLMCAMFKRGEKKSGEMSPDEAALLQTRGHWEDWEFLSAHLGVGSLKRKTASAFSTTKK